MRCLCFYVILGVNNMKKIFLLILFIFVSLFQLYSMRSSKSLPIFTQSSDYEVILDYHSLPDLSDLDDPEYADTEDEEGISDLYGYLGYAIKKNSPSMVSEAIRLGVSVEQLHLDLLFKTFLDKKKYLEGECAEGFDNYDLTILDLLLSNGVKIKSSHLNVAIFLRSYDLIKFLVSSGVKFKIEHIDMAESLNSKSIVTFLKIKTGQYFHLYDRSDRKYWP